jgi:chromosome segregation ATPase
MSTKPLNEFDEKAARAELSENFHKDGGWQIDPIEGARWQFTQLKSQLEAKDLEIERLGEIVDMQTGTPGEYMETVMILNETKKELEAKDLQIKTNFEEIEKLLDKNAEYMGEIQQLEEQVKALPILRESLGAERAKSKALQEMMEHNQRTIAVMDHHLRFHGVNFDFSKVDEMWNALKESGDE